MIKFSYYPSEVINSKRLTSEERDLWLKIFENRCAGGYCKLTNEELADKLGWKARTVQYHLAHLVEKNYAGNFAKDLRHSRRIYINIPGETNLYEPKPTDEDLAKMSDDLCESMRKAVVLGDTNFDALVSALKASDYLDTVEDNTTQFVLTLEQVKFLAQFMGNYPNKTIDCQISSFVNVDYNVLLNEIENSELLVKDNLSLKWCLEHYTEISIGKWRKLENKQDEEESPLQRAMKRLGGVE